MKYHVAGIDLSLSDTGVAVCRHDDNGEPGQMRPHVESIRSAPAKSGLRDGKPYTTLWDTQQRIRRHAARIVLATSHGLTPGEGTQPVAVIEAPMFGGSAGERGVWDRAWLRGMVIDALLSRGWIVVEVAPTALKRYATGSGAARKGANPKAAVLLAVRDMFPSVFTDNDNEADALVLAAMGCRQIGAPREPSVQRCTPSALDSVDWPSDTASRNLRANTHEGR